MKIAIWYTSRFLLVTVMCAERKCGYQSLSQCQDVIERDSASETSEKSVHIFSQNVSKRRRTFKLICMGLVSCNLFIFINGMDE